MNRPVLLAEDNEDDIFLMRYAWRKAGVTHPLQVTVDGQLAIDALEVAFQGNDRESQPCLVLLDLKMPRVPGLDVLQWIRSDLTRAGLPVVILTASSADVDIRAAYRSGANSYFAKPSSSEELLELVRLLDQYWLKTCLLAPP